MEQVETKIGRGIVTIFPEKCKGCGFCIEFCPTHVLEFSEEFNSKGYHYPVDVKSEDCSGCDLCGLYCPDFAIFGTRIKDIEKKGIKLSEVQKGVIK